MRLEVESFCSSIGRSPLLVQGAGGNVSWKDGDVLWIKASGTWLADAGQQDIFTAVDLADLRYAISEGDFSVTPKTLDTALRPSIETLMHAIMPHRVVVHLHAVAPLARLVRADWSQEVASRMPTSIRWGKVRYQKPGADLARAIRDILGEASDIEVIFLQSHGIVLGASDVSGALKLLETIVQAFEQPIRQRQRSMDIGPLPDRILSLDYSLVGDPHLHELASDPELFQRIGRDWALYPDHVVFLGSTPAQFDGMHAFESWLNAGNPLPELAFISGTGVVVRPTFSKAKLAQLRCYYDVLTRQDDGQELRRLTASDIGELLNWEAERYRKSILK